jgi:hypothetical protein
MRRPPQQAAASTWAKTSPWNAPPITPPSGPSPRPLPEAGLRKRAARQRVLALSEGLQRLSRSAARGGIQPYRALPGGAEAAAASLAAAATRQQLLGPAAGALVPSWGAAGAPLAPAGQGRGPAARESLAVAEWGKDATPGSEWGVLRSLPPAAHTRSGRLKAQVRSGE